MTGKPALRLGLGANWEQFTLLIIVNAFMGLIFSVLFAKETRPYARLEARSTDPAGMLADALGIPAAMTAIAALTTLSGVVVATVMAETLATKTGHA